jgi:hypothetical protein
MLEPGAATQAVPAQQSAEVVQAPSCGTQVLDPQTNGGVMPEGFGIHGRLQQSALEAHAVPGGGGPFALQS